MEYRRKLIEVALPLKAISAASAKEKSIRHGHPSTLQAQRHREHATLKFDDSDFQSGTEPND